MKQIEKLMKSTVPLENFIYKLASCVESSEKLHLPFESSKKNWAECNLRVSAFTVDLMLQLSTLNFCFWAYSMIIIIAADVMTKNLLTNT
jgi:hypothetical protein